MHIKRSGDDLFTSFLQLIAENQRLVAETDEDNKVILSIINFQIYNFWDDDL